MWPIAKIRQDFPFFSNKTIYLDNGATTLKPQAVIDQVNKYNGLTTVNVHRGDYQLAYEVSKAYDSTRDVVKNFINAKSSKEIVFTSGATQALNFIALSYGMKHIKKGDIILSTLSEHASCILPWFNVAAKKEAIIKYIPQHSNALIDLEAFKKMMNEKVKVVTLAHISNVFGCEQPLKEIIDLAHQYGAIVIVDGAQSVPHIPVDVQALDIDFLAFSGHKMCAPTGIGVLYGKFALLDNLEPVFFGGDSNARFKPDGTLILQDTPLKFESGTPNIAGVLGLKAAITYLENLDMAKIQQYEEELHQYLMEKIRQIPNITIHSTASKAGICTFTIDDIFSQDVASFLANHNLALRSGNHCAKMIDQLINRQDTVRCSLYFYNTKEEIDEFIKVMQQVTVENCINLFV